MKTWIVGLVVATTACSKTECPVIPPPAPAPAPPKPTASEIAIASRKAAAEDAEDVTRRFGIGWRFRTRGADAKTLVLDLMFAKITGASEVDLCRRAELPSIAKDSPNQNASPEIKKRWAAAVGQFDRIECDTVSGMVIAIIPDKTAGWILDPAVPDVEARVKKAYKAATQDAQPRAVEEPSDDPDRYMFTK